MGDLCYRQPGECRFVKPRNQRASPLGIGGCADRLLQPLTGDKSQRIWVLGEAIDLVRLLQDDCMKRGYYVAIAGGVLNKGYSNNDLDLVVVPRTPDEDDQVIKAFLCSQLEIRETTTIGGVTEVLSLSYRGKPVDIAIVNNVMKNPTTPNFTRKFNIDDKVRLKQSKGYVMVKITDISYSKKLNKFTYAADFVNETLQKIFGGFTDIEEDCLS